MPLTLRQTLAALERASVPSTPGAGVRLLYPKADGWYMLDSAGAEAKLGSMTGTKVSALSAASALTGTEVFPAVQGGSSVKVTAAQINAYADPLRNSLTAAQTLTTATDTYVTASAMPIPQARMVAGVEYRCRMLVTKTAAGAGTATFTVRYGTAGAIGDTSRASLSGTSQTAVVDTGLLEFVVKFRTIGAAATILASVRVTHDLASTGLAARAVSIAQAASSSFDSTPAGSILGISVNAGVSGAWTVQDVGTDLVGLT